MKSITDILGGGDLRSTGKSEQAVAAVLQTPALFPDLFTGMFDPDRLVRMRAADAVEKATRIHPEWLQPWKAAILDQLSTVQDKEFRWHVAQLLPRLRLTSAERAAALDLLQSYLNDSSSIVKTFAMQAIADLTAQDDRLLDQVLPLLESLTASGTPAMRSRGRKLLKRFQSKTAEAQIPKGTSRGSKPRKG